MRRSFLLGIVIGVITLAVAASLAVVWLNKGERSNEGQAIYKLGVFSDLTGTNPWADLFGPSAGVWNSYMLGDQYITLFGYTDKRFDWVPRLAVDFPTEPAQEDTNGDGQISEGDLFTSIVKLKRGVLWSDGTEITSADVKFVFDVASELKLPGDWASYADPEVLDHVEIIDDYTLKFFLKKRSARYKFGILFAPILQKRYWDPKVAEARQSTDPMQALFALENPDEPTAGGFSFHRWQKGAFIEKIRSEKYFFSGSKITLYSNGAVKDEKPGAYAWTGYGRPEGPVALDLNIGPFVDRIIYRIYDDPAKAIAALQRGEIDFLLNPSGLPINSQRRLQNSPSVAVIINKPNSFRYLAFNVRREPMSYKEFRRAIAYLVDREFVTTGVLQGEASPAYSVVPEGNVNWHNPSAPKLGQGMSRAERVKKAVELLKSAGFSWEQEPQVSDDPQAPIVQEGRGLKLPNGELVRELELLAPSDDPLRATFARYIADWLNEVGIPVKTNLIGLNAIATRVFVDQDFDMQILGWGLSIYPLYLRDFFHSSKARKGDRNAGGFSNAEFDGLADQFVAETDIVKARELVFKLQEILAEELPYIVLFDTPLLEAYRADRIKFPYTQALDGIQGANGMTTTVQPVQ